MRPVVFKRHSTPPQPCPTTKLQRFSNGHSEYRPDHDPFTRSSRPIYRDSRFDRRAITRIEEAGNFEKTGHVEPLHVSHESWRHVART
jgi:hypothetical protein